MESLTDFSMSVHLISSVAIIFTYGLTNVREGFKNYNYP